MGANASQDMGEDCLEYPDADAEPTPPNASCSGRSGDLEDIESLGKPITKIVDFETLEKVVVDLVGEFANMSDRKDLQKFLDKERRKYKKQYSYPQILYGYRIYCCNNEIDPDPKLVTLLQKKAFRSQSGVMVVTIFTDAYPDGQPFSCEYDCYYCPNFKEEDGEQSYPRSYLPQEPGVLRAARMKFDCVGQFRDRCKTYFALGHPVDKIEVIVLGGTWSSYPKSYQDRFIRDIYYAANTFYDRNFDTHRRDPFTLEEEMKINQSARCHIIGLGLETRPDRINVREIKAFRHYGVTKALIGVQSVFDKYLERVNRRCNTRHTIRAIKLLKETGFKVQCHIMFDLPQPLKDGVDPQKPIFEVDDIDWSVNVSDDDHRMVDILLENPDLRFDEIKLYPTMTVDHTRILEEYKRGVYKPYGEEKDGVDLLFDNIMYFMEKIPPWMRADRIIRDIPVTVYSHAGTKRGNMGQDIHQALRDRNIKCMDIRFREVKKNDIDPSTVKFFHRIHEGSGGEEHFLSFETEDEQYILGFLRLRLSEDAGYAPLGSARTVAIPELRDCAMIRELHVYGQTVAVRAEASASDMKSTQHAGYGTRLLTEAFRIAQDHGYEKISVISGIGVMNYYRRFGFEIEGDNNYMIKHFET